MLEIRESTDVSIMHSSVVVVRAAATIFRKAKESLRNKEFSEGGLSLVGYLEY